MYMKTMIYDTVVIGGGAAGLLASCVAAENGYSVALIEKNDYLGKKLRITGKGRCNVTNNCSVREVIENIPTGGKFLYGAVSVLPPEKVMAMFEEMGVPLKTERGNRVFPISDKSADIVNALKKRVDQADVSVLHTCAVEILTDEGVVVGVMTDKGKIECRCVILCTGGASYPLTGSDGSGYKLAQKLGHTLTAQQRCLGRLIQIGTELGEGRQLAVLCQIGTQSSRHLLHGGGNRVHAASSGTGAAPL